MYVKLIFVFIFLPFLIPSQVFALLPSEVLVIANRFAPDSVKLAHYYMEKRGIPKENLLKITTTEKEGCSRDDYDENIARPVKKAVLKNKQIKALVTVYGVPLKVGSPKLNTEEKWQLEQLQYESKQLKAALKKLKEKSELKSEEQVNLKSQLNIVSHKMKELRKGDYSAAVDSELTLLMNDNYDLKFWLPNPYFVGNSKLKLPIGKDDVLFVSRLDGPSPDIVRRIIDDSLTAEENGLTGKAYFDAKSKRSTKKKLKGTGFYDQSLHLAADQVLDRKILSVVVDEKGELFQPGDAPEAALYCGWYSYAKYIDAFDWVPGAVGYHIASVECATLRPGKSQVWCKRMLEDGAAAVIGPVDEPYVQAFPVPEIFFHYLTDGYYNLVESYFLSVPYISWRMVLVGDPLYRPFKNSRLLQD